MHRDSRRRRELPRGSRIGVVVQSTYSRERFTDIVKALSEILRSARGQHHLHRYQNRQNEAERLAHEVDVMVVVGGKTSANTKHFAELAERMARARHIEGPEDLRADWFDGVHVAGLMSGASTPGWLVDQVQTRMEELSRQPA